MEPKDAQDKRNEQNAGGHFVQLDCLFVGRQTMAGFDWLQVGFTSAGSVCARQSAASAKLTANGRKTPKSLPGGCESAQDDIKVGCWPNEWWW